MGNNSGLENKYPRRKQRGIRHAPRRRASIILDSRQKFRFINPARNGIQKGGTCGNDDASVGVLDPIENKLFRV